MSPKNCFQIQIGMKTTVLSQVAKFIRKDIFYISKIAKVI